MVRNLPMWPTMPLTDILSWLKLWFDDITWKSLMNWHYHWIKNYHCVYSSTTVVCGLLSTYAKYFGTSLLQKNITFNCTLYTVHQCHTNWSEVLLLKATHVITCTVHYNVQVSWHIFTFILHLCSVTILRCITFLSVPTWVKI